MAAALTRRAKITLGRGADLSIEGAIETMVACFPHNAGKIGYLLDLLPMEIGKRNASFVTELVASLLSQLRTIQDLAPAGDAHFSSEVVKEAFRKRLYLAGIPRKLTDALLTRLDAVSRQQLSQPPASGPATITGDAPRRPPDPAPAGPSVDNAARLKTPAAPVPVLTLTYRETHYLADFSRETYEIGRNPTSFVVVNNDKVSRLHVTLTAKDGRYVLTDQSRNGTAVKIGGRPSVLLERTSIVLEEAGVIALGVDPDAAGSDDSAIIRFRLT